MFDLQILNEQRSDAFTFQLVDSTGNALPFAGWSKAGSTVASPGTAILASLVQAGLAEISSDGATVMISTQLLATLEDERAKAIGLPPQPPFILQIDSRGALGSMRLETRWVNNDWLRLRDARIEGLILRANGQQYRLASPLFELTKAIEAFNGRDLASPAEQALAWAEIQELIGVDPDHIKRGRFLERIRVARATRFSLDFVPDERGGFQIAPVPMAAHRGSRSDSASDAMTSSMPDDAETSLRLLSSIEQAKFQRAFQSKRDVQGSYLGGDDVFVLLAPEVQESLKVVRAIQDRPIAERVDFARNPYPYFVDAMAPDSEPPFVESRSFSDRVLGLGRLEKVTLPWQILTSHGWLPPETVSVTIGERRLTVPPEAIEPAIVDIEHAMANGKSSVNVAGHNVPAAFHSRDAFLEARKTLDERAAAEHVQPGGDPVDDLIPKGPGDRIGLRVKRNLDDAQYAIRRTERAVVPTNLPAIETQLKKHQSEAVAWLQRRWAEGHNGALLADDMGVGKTLSALAFMTWLRSAMLNGQLDHKPILIVAPVSLLENWQAEHERHVGEHPVGFVDIVKAYGSTLPRRAAGRDIESGAAMLDLDHIAVDRFGKPTCVLTTYETLRDYQQSFAAIHFALVVLDEAQRIKNPASLTWHAVSALNSEFWLALTGTPVENRLADLWAIADVLEPGFLGTLQDFSARYEGDFNEGILRELKALLEESEKEAPFMLRRMKDQVLDGIPRKHEHLKPRAMPPVQESAYAAVVSEAHGITQRGQMLAIIQKLREISLHPLRPDDAPMEEYVASSARFQSLFPILDDIAARKEKALVFLDRNAIEAYLAQIIQRHYNLDDLPPVINGEVPGKRRQQLVDAFQGRGGFGVMLLSPKVGGVGLTLTAANHVIHLSRWWNPAVEDQSTDRVYRIGQQKEVHVYYLQATLANRPEQSFDERLHALLRKKRGLSHDLLWPFHSDEGDAAALLGTPQTEATTS